MRVAGYVRVSTEMQLEGFSIDAQRRLIGAYCEAHSYPPPVYYADEGVSARSDEVAKRPAFAQMLLDAEAGRFDVLIVHRLDRFSRSLITTLETLKRLERVGVGFISINEQMDFTSPIGKVILATLAAFAQYYSDNLSTETKKGKLERKRQGLYNGLLPFGVTKDMHGIPVLATEPWACHRLTREELSPASGLKLAFTLASRGMSDREIARVMNDHGYMTSGNRGQNPFTKDAVRTILRNRFYLGDLPDGEGGWLPSKHNAMVDPELFAAVERARAGNPNRTRQVAPTRQPWALSGIATCGTCGGPMRVHGKRRVECSGKLDGLPCTEPSFYARVIEDQLGEILAAVAPADEDMEFLLLRWRRAQTVDVSGVARRRTLNTQLKRVRELYLEGDLSREEYRARKGVIDAELANLPPDDLFSELRGAVLAESLREMGLAWKLATAGERNRIARTLFAEVVIHEKRVVRMSPRPEFRAFFPDSSDEIPHLRKRRGTLSRVGYDLWTEMPATTRDSEPTRPQWQPKLTGDQVQRIRESDDSLRSLAMQYGVSRETIRKARQRPTIAKHMP